MFIFLMLCQRKLYRPDVHCPWTICIDRRIMFSNYFQPLSQKVSMKNQFQYVSQKIKTADVFLKLGKQTSVYERQPPWLAPTKFFLVQFIECWKMPSGERNISEHEIIEHTQITTKKCFFLCVSVINLVGIWNRNKQTDWFWLDKSSNQHEQVKVIWQDMWSNHLHENV